MWCPHGGKELGHFLLPPHVKQSQCPVDNIKDYKFTCSILVPPFKKLSVEVLYSVLPPVRLLGYTCLAFLLQLKERQQD